MAQNKIKVGLLISDIAYGGAAKSIYLLLKNLNKSIYEIHLFTNNIHSEVFYKKFQKLCLTVECINLPTLHYHITSKSNSYKFHKELDNAKNSIFSFVSKLLVFDLDILHINTTLFAYLLPDIKKYTSLKIICHVREFLTNDYSYLSQLIINNINTFADQVIAISDNEAEPFIMNTNLKVIANPYEFINEESISRTIETSRKVIRIGMFGNFKKGRKHLLILETINFLVRNNREYLFVFVGVRKKRSFLFLLLKRILGRGDLDFKFYRYIKEHKLEKYIELFENTPNINDHYASIDIYVRPDGLPWGRDIIEAMAHKLPVIAAGSSQFFVKDGVTGFLTKNDNYKEIAERINSLAEDNVLRNELGLNGFKIVQEMCDAKNHAKIVESIYEKLSHRS